MKTEKIINKITIGTFAFILIANFSVTIPKVAPTLNGELSDAQSKAVDILIESTGQFTAFALAIFGGISFFYKERLYKSKLDKKTEIKEDRINRMRILIILSSCFLIISICCGSFIPYLAIQMLENDILDLAYPGINFAVRAQYLFLLMALVLFSFVVFDE